MTSCKDYDDDINNLQDQIDANKKAIDQINALITSGSVIKNVKQSSTGLTITLSNGQSYNVINGKDGAPGTAWTISDDGYWVKDGVKTEYKALGKDGTPGAPGADGAYYLPKEDGYFYKVVNGKEEPTKIQWKASDKDALTGVINNEYLTLSNVLYPDGTYKDFKISLSNNLCGFSFVTDKAVTGEDGVINLQPETVVDGVEAIQIQSFGFNALTLKNKDSKDENAEEASAKTVINPDVYAYYKVEPATASIEDLKKLSYRVTADANYISTRAAASSDFAVTPEFVEFKDGILKVKVGVKGIPATEKKISLVSLQAKKRNDEVVEQSDDPETIFKNDMKDLRIADAKVAERTPAVADYHYRRYMNTADNEAGDAVKTKPVWNTQDGTDYDLNVNYDQSIDLKEYTLAHELLTPHSVADLNALGMHFEYELVKNYKIGTNMTDQADFATLANGVLTPKVFSDSKKFAAVNRTPIVRVLLKDAAGNIVKVAYIKVKITKDVKPAITTTLDLGELEYKCGEALEATTTVEQINVSVYNKADMDRDAFHTYYSKFKPLNGETVDGVKNAGTAEEKVETIDGETTHLIKLTITEADAWEAAKNGGKAIKHVVRYENADDPSQAVVITLTATLKGYVTSYDITEPDYIQEYWNSDKTLARFNVAVPAVGETDPTKCTMVNDLNAPFVTKEGKVVIPDAITNLKFFFCKDMESVKNIGGIDVMFTVADEGLTLKATVNGTTEEVATINNDGSGVPYNYVTLNKESGIAKQLLNTNKFVVYYGAKGNLCGDETKEATITFKGKDHFSALFVRPVNIAGVAQDKFVDAVDFGEKGSYIRLEDLVAPTDWRDRAFTGDYANYWQYYGPFTITADTDNAEVYLNGKWQPKPATVELKQVSDDPNATDDLTSDYGYLTYKNNGTHVKNFKVRVPVKVEYGWGVITVANIEIPVAETIASVTAKKK